MLASARDQQSHTLIFLPAWNEGESIETVIADVQEQLPGATILVIDDGSHDDTVESARQAGAEVAVLPFHIGLGAALQTGYRYAQEKGFKYFAHLDSDGQHPPNQLPRILEPTWSDSADLVLGSRFTQEGDTPGSEFRSSPLRRVWIHILARLVTGIHGQRFTDITSGFRAGNHRAIDLFTQIYQPDFGEIEAVQTALARGLRVKEVPVVMLKRELGESYLTALPSIRFMFKAFLNLMVGRFRGTAH
jgi:glycosyltransferase involved in cell wall biosynthesis